jgi:hypothetical protein
MPFFIEQLADRHRNSPPFGKRRFPAGRLLVDSHSRLHMPRSNYARHAKTKLLLLAKSDLIYVKARAFGC